MRQFLVKDLGGVDKKETQVEDFSPGGGLWCSNEERLGTAKG